MERRLPREKVYFWVYLARYYSLVFGNFGTWNLPNGTCRKFKPHVLVEWKAPYVTIQLLGGYSLENFSYFFFPWFVRICLSYVLIKVSSLQKCLYSQMP